MKTHGGFLGLFLSLFFGCLGGSPGGGGGGGPSDSPRLIQFGGSFPSTETFRQKLASMESTPFGGAVVWLKGGDRLFRTVAYPDADFAEDQANLKAASSAKLTDVFVRLQGTMENGWDWYSDDHWAAAERNLRNIAATAHQGKTKGLFFDPEAIDAYGIDAWRYSAQRQASSRTFADYQVQVRARGRQFGRAYESAFPGGALFSAFGLSGLASLLYDAGGQPRSSVDPAALQDHPYGLFPSFLEGILEGTESLRLVDGDESGYYFRRASEFDRGRARILQHSLILLDPALRSLYLDRIEVAHAVYLDGILDLHRSSYPLYFGYYLASDAERLEYLQHNVFHALRTSDHYVWIYGENTGRVDFWNGLSPPGLLDAVSTALAQNRQGQPLGFDFDEVVAAGEARILLITGAVSASGTPLAGVTFRVSTAGDPSDQIRCSASDASGEFVAYVKTGWSGTITPQMTGRSFTPATLSYTNVTAKLSDQIFTASP